MLRLQREGSTSPFVFVSERGAPFSISGFRRMVERATETARLEIKAHPHMLRHACGYALANQGTDTRTLQAYLGHRSISNTVRARAWQVQGLVEGLTANSSSAAARPVVPITWGAGVTLRGDRDRALGVVSLGQGSLGRVPCYGRREGMPAGSRRQPTRIHRAQRWTAAPLSGREQGANSIHGQTRVKHRTMARCSSQKGKGATGSWSCH
jgi:hypothetical protein